MKKYILTSPSFDGNVIFGYDDDHELLSLYSNESEMNSQQRAWLLKNLPCGIAQVSQLAKLIKGKLEEMPEDISFNSFWEAYKKKINKVRTEPLFNKLSDADKLTAIRRIRPYDDYLSRTNFRGKADPENYLKKRMFETDWSKER